MYASVLYTFFPCIYITYHCIFGMFVAGKHTGGVCSSIWYVLGFPVVRFTCGLEMAVTPEKFLVKIGGGVVAIRRQLPLRLAWAISVHKSQVLFMTWRAGTVNQYTQSGLLHWWKFAILNIMPLNFRMLFLKERNEDLLILTNFPQTTPCYIPCSGSSPVMIPCSSTHVPYLIGYDIGLCWDIAGKGIWGWPSLRGPVSCSESAVYESDGLPALLCQSSCSCPGILQKSQKNEEKFYPITMFMTVTCTVNFYFWEKR